LYAAAMLHDIGRYVNPSAHHKHSAYLVRHSAMEGWRPENIDLLAAIVRYHRKALPKPAHIEWAALIPADRTRVERLAALLRLADGLDRRRMGVVGAVSVVRKDGEIEIVARSTQTMQPEIEAVLHKADLFERAFGLRLRARAESVRVEGEVVPIG